MKEFDNEKNPLILNDDDGCLIFRNTEDGGVNLETYLPAQKDDDHEASDSTILCYILAARLMEQNFVDEQYKWLENKHKKSKESNENDER